MQKMYYCKKCDQKKKVTYNVCAICNSTMSRVTYDDKKISKAKKEMKIIDMLISEI